jgi:hypothetical protein
MRRLLFAATAVLLALAFVAPAASTGGAEEVAQPAKALAIQALAILEQGGSHEQAMERLTLAAEAEDKEGVMPQVLEEAMAALEAEDPVRGEELLKTAFTGENVHVVGVTVRPGSNTARVIAGVAGGLILLLAVFGLARRARIERRLDAG